MKTFMTIVIVTIMAIALMVYSAVMDGWVLTILWRWFMVPVFGLPSLGIVYAIGVSLVISLLTHQASMGGKDNNAIATLASHIVKPFLFLLVGWVVTLFI